MVRVTSPSAVDRSWHHGWAETISVGVGAVPAPLSQKRWAWPVKASMARAALSGEDASPLALPSRRFSRMARASMSCAVMCSGQSEMAALGRNGLALPHLPLLPSRCSMGAATCHPRGCKCHTSRLSVSFAGLARMSCSSASVSPGGRRRRNNQVCRPLWRLIRRWRASPFAAGLCGVVAHYRHGGYAPQLFPQLRRSLAASRKSEHGRSDAEAYLQIIWLALAGDSNGVCRRKRKPGAQVSARSSGRSAGPVNVFGRREPKLGFPGRKM